jgi:lysophospholipase L1-like esterase
MKVQSVKKSAVLLFALLISPAFADGIQNPGASGGGGFPLQAGASQLSPAQLNSFRKIFSQAINKTGGPILIPMFGDSTMAGVGIGTGGSQNMNGAWARSWPQTLTRMLANLGIPTQINSVFGDGNITQYVAYNAYNSQVVLGSGFVTNSLAIPGGFAFTCSCGGGFNNASSTFSFTPPNNIDSFYVFWGGRGGTATVNVDGGAALTVTSGLSAGLSTVTVPASFVSFANAQSLFNVTAGAHTINVVVQSGTTTDIMGVRAFLSTGNYIDLMPVPASGAKIASFDNPTGTFRDGKYFVAYVPGIQEIIIDLTVNDIANGTTGASYTSSLTDMATFDGSNWVFMLGPYIAAMGTVGNNPIVQAINTYGAAHNQPTLDFATRWIGGATNLTGGDGIHPTFAGHGDIARYLAFLMSQM